MNKIDSELIIGGVHIPIYSKMVFNQTYERIGGVYQRRFMNGRGKKQFNWVKIRTTITAQGPSPSGLDLLDFESPMEISCAKPKVAHSTGLVFVIPATRRSDTGFTPFADAYVDMQWVPASMSISTNTCTLTAVPGAEIYRVSWYPKFNANVNYESDDTDMIESTYSWSITAEEV